MHIPVALLQRPALSQLHGSPSEQLIPNAPPAEWEKLAYPHKHSQTHTVCSPAARDRSHRAVLPYVSPAAIHSDNCCATHVPNTRREEKTGDMCGMRSSHISKSSPIPQICLSCMICPQKRMVGQISGVSVPLATN